MRDDDLLDRGEKIASDFGLEFASTVQVGNWGAKFYRADEVCRIFGSISNLTIIKTEDENMQNQGVANEALRIAKSQIGVHESTGKNDGEKVNEYQDFVGPHLHGQPWCACFVSWCIYHAAQERGITLKLHKTAGSQDFYNQSIKDGLHLSSPIPGCIGLLKGGNGHDHTFLVEVVDLHAGLVHSIDGNWGNAVTRTSHPINRCDFVAVG